MCFMLYEYVLPFEWPHFSSIRTAAVNYYVTRACRPTSFWNRGNKNVMDNAHIHWLHTAWYYIITVMTRILCGIVRVATKCKEVNTVNMKRWIVCVHIFCFSMLLMECGWIRCSFIRKWLIFVFVDVVLLLLLYTNNSNKLNTMYSIYTSAKTWKH